MAFLEWRRFSFFELTRNADSGRVAECLKDRKVVDSSSGYGHLVFGDSEGGVHLVNRGFQVTTFSAYALRVCLVKQMRHAPLLVTIGEDEPGINPVIKVWNLDKLDKMGLPMCVRISRAIPNNRPTPASVLCVHENLSLMAVGFSDGSVILYRGDVTRDRSSKQKVLRDGGMHPITGLEFRSSSKLTYLFVSTSSHVFFYNITVKDKEEKIDLDSVGCEKRCSTLAESTHDGHFMIGRDDAIYCYTPDGRGPCYAVEGQKVMLEWFRNYLVIVAKDTKTRASTTIPPPASSDSSNSSMMEAEAHMVTILDIQNKFMVLQAPICGVMSVLSEWGSLFVLCGRSQSTLFHLQEKDLQSKLSLLFKKNLYDVAIRIAKSHQYDAEGLADIFCQYGDHLYSKGDHAGAIEQYMKTIGRLEPSYVIRKFLDSQHIENLTTYLQALHKQGQATEDHTTLLLNCYTKLDKTDRLKEFIMTKDREVDFDVEIAIKVCRQASSEDALLLARKHGMHDWYLKIQIEDHARYKEALEYIAKLEFSEAESNMKKYGNILLHHVPDESTQFLAQLCTDYRPSDKPLVDTSMLHGSVKPLIDQANPGDFIHLFNECPQRLEVFLEYLLKEHTEWNPLVYNTLLEHYLNAWGGLESAGTVETSQRIHYEQCIMRLLNSSDARYDRDQVLILCQANNFKPGLLHILEECHLYQQIVQYHMMQRDYKAVLASCRRFGNQDPNLWVQALWYCARDSHTPPHLLEEILQVIEKEKSLPPLLVLDALCTSSEVTLANVRSYLLNVLQTENQLAQREQELVQKYRQESERIRQQIQNIQTKSMIFQISRCSACNHQLELPSVHFLCLHSYHQHCFQSFSESENECPSCLPSNRKILDIIKSQEQSRDLHETFHCQLDRAEDGFSLVADYFGRGVFNKLTVVTDTPVQIPFLKTEKPVVQTHGLGAEARMRIGEQPSAFEGVGANSNLKATGISNNRSSSGQQPLRLSPGNTLRNKGTVQLDTDFSSLSITGNPAPTLKSDSSSRFEQSSNNRMPETKSSMKTPIPAARIAQTTMPSSAASNPFEDVYDEAKNPFADDDEDATNPFKEDASPSTNPFDDDDYDKNKNPFAD